MFTFAFGNETSAMIGSSYMNVYIHDIHSYTQHTLYMYIHTYIHTYMYIHSYIHTSYIHTYIHTYIHLYIHTFMYLYLPSLPGTCVPVPVLT